MESDGTGCVTISLPEDIWSVIISHINIYDTIFLRATSKWFYKACKKYQPFPKHHVLDQDKCMAYLIELHSISCLEYAKNALNFEWTEEQCASASRSGKVDVLKYLRDNGCPINTKTVLLECTKGTCNIDVIKYLYERGVSWEQEDPTATKRSPLFSSGLHDRNYTVQIVTENMAFHGHLECLKYAVENGCKDKRIWYTPSTECLDFVIANGFDWTGGIGSRKLGMLGKIRPVKLSFCEQAAKLGDLKMLKYGFEKGAPLQSSDSIAANEGHLDCLKFSFENKPVNERTLPSPIKTVECCKFVLDNLSQDLLNDVLTKNTYFLWTTAAYTSVDYLKLLHEKIKLPDSALHKELIISASAWSVNTLKYARDVLKLEFAESHPFRACGRAGNVEVLQYIKENFLPHLKVNCDARTIESIINEAIFSRHVDVLKFVWEEFPNKEGVSLEEFWDNAVKYSTPEILEFLTEHGAQWTSKHLVATSNIGNLTNMAYLTRIGCKWNDEKCDTKSQSALCVKYARERGCTQFNLSE